MTYGPGGSDQDLQSEGALLSLPYPRVDKKFGINRGGGIKRIRPKKMSNKRGAMSYVIRPWRKADRRKRGKKDI